MYISRLKQHQFTRWNGSTQENIVYSFNSSTNSIEEVLGTVPQNTYQEYNGVQGLANLDLSWSFDKENSTTSSVSASLVFYDDAFRFVKDWLIERPEGFLNAIDIEIWDDVYNKKVGEYKITSNGISYCFDDCSIKVNLKLQDEVLSCFERTLIDDDHQGWFRDTTTHFHPSFVYCNITESEWEVWLFYILLSAITVLLIVIVLIISIINLIITVINALPLVPDITPIQVLDDIEDLVAIYNAIFGCTRKHHAPYIRDYIKNVCDKCSKDLGITIALDATPFVANNNNVNPALNNYKDLNYGTGSIFGSSLSPYYNTCYFHPSTEKGVLKEVNQFYKRTNAPIKNLKELLDELKGVFNARWYVKQQTNGDQVLYFEKKSSYINQPLLFDFTTQLDYALIYGSICFEWDTEKSPAYLQFSYSDDAMDNVGNYAKRIYNDIVDFNTGGNNKYYEGGRNVLLQFSPVRVYDDNLEPEQYNIDYFPGAVEVLGTSLSVGFDFWNIAEQGLTTPSAPIIMSGHTTTSPKLLIHDPLLDDQDAANNQSYVKQYPNAGSFPLKNPTNNTSDTYTQVNKVGTHDRNTPANLKLYNYPLFFEPKFLGNLYDYFWQIEDTRGLSKKNRVFTIELRDCSAVLERLGIWHNQQAQILATIRVPLHEPYSNERNLGYITELSIKRTNNQRIITLKGKI